MKNKSTFTVVIRFQICIFDILNTAIQQGQILD